jgi:hypothetical protein
MLVEGEIVRGRVVRVEMYGVYLKYYDDTILVLIPDWSWKRIQYLSQSVNIGDDIDVQVMRYVPKDKVYRGCVKCLHPEDCIYLCSPRNTIFRGKVRYLSQESVSILLDQYCGSIPREFVTKEVRIGDEIDVVLRKYDLDLGLIFEPIHQ